MLPVEKDKVPEWVDLDEFSHLVGWPLELIRRELFLNDSQKPADKVRLTDLRVAMASFLDRTMGDKT